MLTMMFLLLAMLCTATACKRFTGRSRTTHRQQTSLSMSTDFKRGVALLTLPLSLLSISPSYADESRTNPEAIDIRRIEQQPTQAPSPPKKKTVTLPSGVQYYDAVDGTGTTAEEGKSVTFEWVLRRSNGYFVDASSNYGTPESGGEPFIYKVGNLKKVIPGLDEAIRGMKVQGVRRMNIPANLAYSPGGVTDGSPGPVPSGFGPRRQILTRIGTETWYFEIKLLKVK